MLSPKLFNVFVEYLSSLLKSVRIGCFMNSTCFNHLFYADDAILLAPSPEALQKLLDVCFEFARNNEMLYNVKKSCCIAFIPSLYGHMNLPNLYLESSMLKWETKKKYLSYILDSNVTDDLDIQRQINCLYARGNSLVRNLSYYNKDVKLQLFKTYCYSLYMCQLWCAFKKCTRNGIKVAYNNIFRILMNVSRRVSISAEFVSNNVVF